MVNPHEDAMTSKITFSRPRSEIWCIPCMPKCHLHLENQNTSTAPQTLNTPYCLDRHIRWDRNYPCLSELKLCDQACEPSLAVPRHGESHYSRSPPHLTEPHFNVGAGLLFEQTFLSPKFSPSSVFGWGIGKKCVGEG